jgi:hypothetical protein
VQSGDEGAIEAAVDAASRACPECPRPPYPHAIIAGGPGLVAVGAYDALGDRADIWTSSDGQTWSRVRGDLGPGVIEDVTTGGPGLVAVGNGKARRFHAAVWTSRDGLSWNRAPDDPVFKGARMELIRPGGPGLVAFGGGRASRYRAWFSSDGLTWEVAVHPEHYFPVWMIDVAAAGDRLVAVGTKLRNTGEDVVIWTSADGMTWMNVPVDREVFPDSSSFDGVTGGPDGFTIVGERLAEWTSADGLRWRRVGS